MVLLDIVKECFKKPYADVVCSVVIVAVSWEVVAVTLKTYCKTLLVALYLNFCLLDSAQRVDNM